MPFAIDLKFIYEPLTSDSHRPTFNAEKPKEKKWLVFHTASTLTYAGNDKRKKNPYKRQRTKIVKKKEKRTRQEREKKNGMVHARTRRQRQESNKERVLSLN